jgi:hypothetical protein
MGVIQQKMMVLANKIVAIQDPSGKVLVITQERIARYVNFNMY